MRKTRLLSAYFVAILVFSVLPASGPAQTPSNQTASSELFSDQPMSSAVAPGDPSSAFLPDAPVPAVPPAGASSSLNLATFCQTGGHPKGSRDTVGNSLAGTPCPVSPNPYDRFLDTSVPVVLTREQKGRLAFHNLKETGNLITITGTAAITIGANAHTAYGPGWKGFGRNTGYSFLQDATGEFFGTFLIPSLIHQDPHYRRMPHASIPRRGLHAIAATVIAQRDDGGSMPNYANLLTEPIDAELSNLYVPGVNGNGPSTVLRILRGYATVPADNLITEFLPDVARHIRVRVIVVQRILNQTSASQYPLP
jgi:hypothetical protein